MKYKGSTGSLFNEDGDYMPQEVATALNTARRGEPAQLLAARKFNFKEHLAQAIADIKAMQLEGEVLEVIVHDIKKVELPVPLERYRTSHADWDSKRLDIISRRK